jgi:hypothetical protein
LRLRIQGTEREECDELRQEYNVSPPQFHVTPPSINMPPGTNRLLKQLLVCRRAQLNRQ